MTAIICGVDVSSTHLDAKIGHEKGTFQRFDRSVGGVAALDAFCKRHAVSLVVMEATGGYEKLAVGLLWAAQMPVAIVNPRSVRRFAEAMGLIEKATASMQASSPGMPASSGSRRSRPPAKHSKT